LTVEAEDARFLSIIDIADHDEFIKKKKVPAGSSKGSKGANGKKKRFLSIVDTEDHEEFITKKKKVPAAASKGAKSSKGRRLENPV
jgi:hypothetical protein